MTRSQAALIIGWLAFVPGALLLSSNAGAIPGTPGQLIVNSEPAADFQPPGEQATSDARTAVQLIDGEPAATPALPDLVSLPEDTIDRQQAFSIQFGRRLAVDSGILGKTDGWNWILPDDRIRHYTSTQRQEVTTHGLSLSHAFSQRFKLSGDVAMLDISNNSLPGSATPPEALPNEYFYHLKLTGKGLLISGNSNKLDIRHRVTGSSRVSTAPLDTRYVINRLWNISPRLRTELRDNNTDKPAEWVASPTVKMEYRWKKAYGFQIEAGGKWSS